MNNQSHILVHCTRDTAWIRVEGKGSFLNSSGLKEFAGVMMNRGLRKFVVDLQHFPVMDSTFMGTLAGIALRLREICADGAVHMVHLNDRNRELLRGLGLDRLFNFDFDGIPPEEAETRIEADGNRASNARTMLEAHEALVEAAPENLAKFKDVLEYLKQDL